MLDPEVISQRRTSLKTPRKTRRLGKFDASEDSMPSVGFVSRSVKSVFRFSLLERLRASFALGKVMHDCVAHVKSLFVFLF